MLIKVSQCLCYKSKSREQLDMKWTRQDWIYVKFTYPAFFSALGQLDVARVVRVVQHEGARW